MTEPQHTHPDAELDPRRWKALALLCTAFFMVILDSAIVLVALPSIDADLAFSAGDVHRRRRVVRGRVPRSWTGGHGGGAAGRSRRAGRGRGDHDADRALDP